jgi:exosortase
VLFSVERRRWARPALAGLAGLVSLILLWPVFQHAFHVWLDNEDLRFGFLLAPTAAWLAWQRRDDLRRSSSRRGTRAALALVLISIAAYLVFERIAARAPAALAAGVLVWSCLWYLWGARAAVLLAFPVGLVTYGLALQQTLIAPIAFALQGLTAVSAERIGNILGLNLVREGLVLRGDTFAFVIAEACSGMNSLLALVGLAGVWAYIVRGRLVSRLALVAAVLPLTVCANTTRVVLVLLVAQGFGEDAATGFFHGASSIALFSIALIGLLSVSRVVGCRAPVTA